MSTLPPEEIAHQQAHIHEDHRKDLGAFFTICIVISAICVVMRIWSRQLTDSGLGRDDYCFLVGAIIAIASFCVLDIYVFDAGLGLHWVALTPAQMTLFPKLNYAYDILNDKGRVVTDQALRVKGHDSTYAAGDINGISPLGLLPSKGQANIVAENILAELGGKPGAREWKPFTTKESLLVPVGKNGGVGALFGWWVPSFGIKFIKSKDFLFSQMPNYVMGKA